MDDNFVLQLKNYQRIKKAKLEFVPGLNIIVGQSNNGKSSILRSIQTAIFNISRESHVTLGETKSAVGIRYRGHEIIWRRDNNAPSPMSYRVDGKILTKLGRGQPAIIADLMGIREVELDEMKIKLNFQKQMEYPFLLDKTPSQLFKFIVQSAEEDNIMDVIQVMKTDLNIISVNVKAYEEARESLRIAAQREIKRYQDKKVVVPYCDRVISLDSKVKRLKEFRGLVQDISRLVKSIAEDEDRNVLITQSYNRMNKTLNELDSSYKRSVGLDGILRVIKDKSIYLDGLDTDYKEVTEELDSFSEFSKRNERFNDVLVIIEKKSNIGGVVNDITESRNRISVLLDTMKDLDERQKVCEECLSRMNQCLSSYEESTEIIQGIEEVVSDINMYQERVESIQVNLSNVTVDLESIKSEISEFDICPFCGNEIGGE